MIGSLWDTVEVLSAPVILDIQHYTGASGKWRHWQGHPDFSECAGMVKDRGLAWCWGWHGVQVSTAVSGYCFIAVWHTLVKLTCSWHWCSSLCCLLGYETVWSCIGMATFRIHMLPPSSWYEYRVEMQLHYSFQGLFECTASSLQSWRRKQRVIVNLQNHTVPQLTQLQCDFTLVSAVSSRREKLVQRESVVNFVGEFLEELADLDL
jgi:hypothetical protein